MKRYIPKGSELYSDGVFISTFNNQMKMDYLPKPEDFTPSIPTGTVINNSEVKHNGKVIYRHPNFV